MRRRLLFVLLALVLSCGENNPEPIYRIDDELLPHLETFLAEARSRGLELKAENLIMEFGTATAEICGECIYPKNGGQRKITIVSKFNLLAGCTCSKP